MSAGWPVRRPTENAALRAVERAPSARLSIGRAADLLIAARATDDRHGAQLFSNRLDRVLAGGAS